MTSVDPKEAMEEIALHSRAIVNGEGSTYEHGWEIWGKAMSVASSENEEAWALWLLWGSLTDWVENKPDERTEAESSMVRAAQEWLALSDDAAEREQYFDRWLYEEMGYKRPDRE